MSIALLKKVNQIAPDGLKKLAAPFIRRQLVGNRIFLDQYELCEHMRHASEDERLSYQMAQLRNLCAFAYAEVPYYREIFDETGVDPLRINVPGDIKALPVLTKDVLKSRFDDLQAACVGDFYEATTGGSSGAPTRVNLERSSIYRERAFVYSFWACSGYRWRNDRMATFRGVDFSGKFSKPNPLYRELLLNPFLLNEGNVGEYVKLIEGFGARFISGYPSAVQNFCRLLKKANEAPPKELKAVFFISETVTNAHVRIVSETLGCPSRAFYGHSERSVFAEQVADGPVYRFNSAYGLAEVVEHSQGNVVCTGFLNRRMPLIRYAVDDWVQSVVGGSLIEGHHDGSYLVGATGERITQTALNFHDGTFDGVDGYQLIQNEPGAATCRVVASRRLSAEELFGIEKALSCKVGGAIVWRVTQDEELELTPRGKRKLIVRHC